MIVVLPGLFSYIFFFHINIKISRYYDIGYICVMGSIDTFRYQIKILIVNIGWSVEPSDEDLLAFD